VLLRAVVITSVVDAVIRVRHDATLQRWKGRADAKADDESDDETVAHHFIVRS
jgi:hypothetical protein